MNTKTKTIKNDDINIVAIFCIVDDVLKNLGLKDDVRAKASNSEILSIAILALALPFKLSELLSEKAFIKGRTRVNLIF